MRVVDTVVGTQYNMNIMGTSFNPFIGVNHVSFDSDFTGEFVGFSGVMVGWTAMHNFSIGSESFTVTNWNEITTLRDDKYLDLSGEDKIGVNGAVSAWWNAHKHLTLGVQYRYATNKLGSDNTANAMVITTKINF